jgi:hypothetical protein
LQEADGLLFQAEPLADAVASGPRIILLDKYLVRQIPSQFSYQPIVSGQSMELGHREKLAAKMAEY